MKLIEVELENVSSFRDRETIFLNDGLNIFIGPNGGGKTNLLEIISAILNHYFVTPWDVHEVDGSEIGATTRSIIKNINDLLTINKDSGNPDKTAIFTFAVTKEDVTNLEIIRDNLNRLAGYQNKLYKADSIKGQFAFIFNELHDMKIYENRRVTFRTLPTLRRRRDDNIPSHEDELFYALFHTYLMFYELISILIEKINSDPQENKITEFNSIIHCISSRRDVGEQSLIVVPNVGGHLVHKNDLKSSGVRGESKLLSYSINFLADKYLLLTKEQFDSDENVVLARNKLRKLGYEFGLEKIDQLTNKCRFLLKNGDTQTDLTKASPGEKSVISLVLFLSCMNIKDGILIIDEPELHLHPKSQKIISDFFAEVSVKYRTQILFATHSPIFVSPGNVDGIQRVYKSSGTTKVVNRVQSKYQVKDKHLIQIVNATNNERIYFSDKVILVEGIGDKIIYEKIMSLYFGKEESSEVFEVLEVDGKENFRKFREFLNQWKIRNYIIADQDYSHDGEDGDVFILKKGTVEDYFGGGHFDTGKAVSIAEKIVDLKGVDDELSKIFREILK